MYLKAVIEQIVDGLIHANVRLDAAYGDLFYTEFTQLFNELRSTARTKGGLLVNLEVIRQHTANFLGCVPKAFWILLGHENRQAKYLKALHRDRRTHGDRLEIRYRLAKTFLYINDGKSRFLRI